MSDTVPVQIEKAHVRSDRNEELRALIRQLFMRRNLSYTAGQEKMWLRAEIVQSLREKSEVYRSMSSKTSGPLVFELGYFRIRDDRLELTTKGLPDPHPEALARLLSEFVEPGAQLIFRPEDEAPHGWVLHGVDDIESMSPAEIEAL